MTVHVRVRVAGEAYAVPVESVLQVAPLGTVTAIPGSHQALLGMQNLRGQLLPVVDLAQLLGIARQAPPSHLVVAEAGGAQAGLAIDEVSGVGELPPAEAETTSGLLAGAALADGELVGVIDVARVFEAVAALP